MKVATITWSDNKDETKIKFSEEFLASDIFLQFDILGELNAELGQRHLETAKNIFASRKQLEKK